MPCAARERTLIVALISTSSGFVTWRTAERRPWPGDTGAGTRPGVGGWSLPEIDGVAQVGLGAAVRG